jgi:hypothetical protein
MESTFVTGPAPDLSPLQRTSHCSGNYGQAIDKVDTTSLENSPQTKKANASDVVAMPPILSLYQTEAPSHLDVTDYQACYLAHQLTRLGAVGEIDQISATPFDAKVDFNPHQVDAALVVYDDPDPYIGKMVSQAESRVVEEQVIE